MRSLVVIGLLWAAVDGYAASSVKEPAWPKPARAEPFRYGDWPQLAAADKPVEATIIQFRICEVAKPDSAERVRGRYRAWLEANREAVARVERSADFNAPQEGGLKDASAYLGDRHSERLCDHYLPSLFGAKLELGADSPQAAWDAFTAALRKADRKGAAKVLDGWALEMLEDPQSRATDDQLREAADSVTFKMDSIVGDDLAFGFIINKKTNRASEVAFRRGMGGRWFLTSL